MKSKFVRMLGLVSGLFLVGCVATHPTKAPETPTVKAFKGAMLEAPLTFEAAYTAWQACVPGTVEYSETDLNQVLVVCKTPKHQELAMQWTGDGQHYRLTRMVVMRQYDQEYSGDEVNTDETTPYHDALRHNQPL